MHHSSSQSLGGGEVLPAESSGPFMLPVKSRQPPHVTPYERIAEEERLRRAAAERQLQAGHPFLRVRQRCGSDGDVSQRCRCRFSLPSEAKDEGIETPEAETATDSEKGFIYISPKGN